MEKVVVEFSVNDRERFLKELQAVDDHGHLQCLGFRADDALDKRVPLKVFSDAMEVKLRKNDEKTTWKEAPIDQIIKLLQIESQKVQVHHDFGSDGIRSSLVDLANWCLILWDRTSRK